MARFAIGNVVAYVTETETLESEPPEPTEYIAVKALLSMSEYNMLQGRILEVTRGGEDLALSLRVQDYLDKLLDVAIVGWRLYHEGKPVPFSAEMIRKLNPSDPLVLRAQQEFTRLNPILGRRVNIG